jgi:hypothetical protein
MSLFKKIDFLLIAYLLILCIAGLWPFTFNPKNNVHRTDNKPGISIIKESILYSEQFAPFLYRRLTSSNGFRIETAFYPDKTLTHGLEFIMACGAVGRQYNFALAQQNSDLIFFLKTTSPPEGKTVHTIRVPNILTASTSQHLAVMCGNGITRLYINGSLVKQVDTPGTFSNWDKAARVFVGNDDSGEHSWEGVLYKIAVYEQSLLPDTFSSEKIGSDSNEALLYYNFEMPGNERVIKDRGGQGFEQDLSIPEYFKVPGKMFLSLPGRNFVFSMGFAADVFINILGFVPLGIIVFMRMRLLGGSEHQALYAGMITGFILSFLLELLQTYLPLRSSSAVDLLNNSLGSVIGGYICLVFLKKGRLQNMLLSSRKI